MHDWAPILMVFGFLAFGCVFVLASDLLDAFARWREDRKR